MSTHLTEQRNIECTMMGLMKELEKLAPHPDRPDKTGPCFARIDSQRKSAAEYAQDRTTNTGYNLGRKKSICAGFNKRAAIWQHMMDVYLQDLPKRLGIERWLADYQRKLNTLQKHAPAP